MLNTPLIVLSLLYALTGRQSNAIFQNIEKSDRILNEAQHRLDDLEKQQVQLQENVADTESRFGEAKLLQQLAYKKFIDRVRIINKMPTGARFVLLGGAHTLRDYLSMKRMLHWVAYNDKKLQQDYLEQAKAYQLLERDLRAQREALAQLLESLTTERDRVAKIRDKKIQLLQRVASERALQKIILKERSKSRKLLAKMVKRLRPKGVQQKSSLALDNNNFARQQRQLPWPTVGRLYTLFGKQVEREHGSVTTHNGIDIIAPVGSSVQAVAFGTVVYSDWFRGYGQIVIIDHGGGYHTLSGHLNGRTVKQGDVVKQGGIIGTVGETGSTAGPLLYFELRFEGTPKNPHYWLRK